MGCGCGYCICLFYCIYSAASLIMYRYPERTPVLAELTPIFTLLKWCLIYASFAALVPGVLISILYYIRTRKN